MAHKIKSISLTIASLLMLQSLNGCEHTHLFPRTAQTKADLTNRLTNAEDIKDIVKRDDAIADITIDAAVSNQPEMVLDMLPRIEQAPIRDKTAEECIKDLDKEGERPSAEKIIPLITDMKTKDDVREFLADHPAPPRPTTAPATTAPTTT